MFMVMSESGVILKYSKGFPLDDMDAHVTNLFNGTTTKLEIDGKTYCAAASHRVVPGLDGFLLVALERENFDEEARMFFEKHQFALINVDQNFNAPELKEMQF